MKHPICPHCGEKIDFALNANVYFRFNEEREKYDEVEIDSISDWGCENCGEAPWGAWEEDESSDLFEKFENGDLLPRDEFRVHQEGEKT